MKRTLIKLGGSLLTLPDVIERLSIVIDGEDSTPVLLVGGGKTSDLVRQWDATFMLGDECAHSLALQAMVLNTQLLATLDDRYLPASSLAEVDAISARGMVPVLDVAQVIPSIENGLADPQHLMPSWNVTSDSIAAWIATHWNMKRLLLLKSVILPADLEMASETPDRFRSAAQLADAGRVDSAFANLGPAVPQFCWCNLRESPKLVARVW